MLISLAFLSLSRSREHRFPGRVAHEQRQHRLGDTHPGPKLRSLKIRAIPSNLTFRLHIRPCCDTFRRDAIRPVDSRVVHALAETASQRQLQGEDCTGSVFRNFFVSELGDD